VPSAVAVPGRASVLGEGYHPGIRRVSLSPAGPERVTGSPDGDEPDRAGHPGRGQQLFFARVQASLLVTSLLPHLT
jgi:hypothetical protein